MSQILRFIRYYFSVIFNRCEHAPYKKFTCDCEGEVQWESGRSMYHTDKKPEAWNNPNRSVLLCRSHAEEWHANWDDLWDQVPRG